MIASNKVCRAGIKSVGVGPASRARCWARFGEGLARPPPWRRLLAKNMQICIMLCMEKIGFSRPASVIAQRARLAGLTQEQIAKAVSASQSQVSRVLAGKSIRSRLHDEICIYVNNALRGVSPEAVCENRELIEALADVWDGTAHHGAALATVIRSLGELNPVAGRRRAASAPSAKEVTNADP